MTVCDTHLVWMDLEMTGLIPEKDRIIEIACIITDAHLNTVQEGPVFAIHQSDARLQAMDAWNTEHHTQSGLVDRVRASTLTEADAEKAILDFIRRYVPEGKSPLCGNTIYQDRRFLYRYMPTLEAYFHYRCLDVSTLKILAQLWAPEMASGVTKVSSHIALEDIRDSIEELKYYRTHFLVCDADQAS